MSNGDYLELSKKVIVLSTDARLTIHRVRNIRLRLRKSLRKMFDFTGLGFRLEIQDNILRLIIEDDLREVGQIITAIALSKLNKLGVPTVSCKELLKGKARRIKYMLFPAEPMSEFKSRNRLIKYICNRILWEVQGSVICGGFVRDWIIRCQECNDIDVFVPGKRSVERVIQVLLSIKGIKFINFPKLNGLVTIIKLQTPFGEIGVDVVTHDNIIKIGNVPYVDCDINNITISNRGVHLKKRVVKPNSITVYPLIECIRNCQQGQFVFFLSFNVSDSYEKRLEKMLDKKFKCLSPIDPKSKFYQPGLIYLPQYDCKWGNPPEPKNNR